MIDLLNAFSDRRVALGSILNSLIRNLFFSHVSPHPARAGGIWRLATGAILL